MPRGTRSSRQCAIAQSSRFRGCARVQHLGWLVAEQREDRGSDFQSANRASMAVAPRVFAELLLRSIRQNRNVRVARRLQPEQPEQQQLARCVVQQIGAANDLRDVLCRIVDDDRELIGDDAVASKDDEVANVAIEALGIVALHQVFEPQRFVGNSRRACDDGPVEMVWRLRHVPG